MITLTENDLMEASLWLNLTQWPEYTHRHTFFEVAELALLSDPVMEPILAAVELSIKRLIQCTIKSISSYHINEFNQVHINSFI